MLFFPSSRKSNYTGHFVRRDGCVVWKDRPRHSAQSYTPNHSIACNGTPINLNGEDIWNKKVKVLRSICRLEPCSVILGRYEDTSGDKVDVKLNSQPPHILLLHYTLAMHVGMACLL